MPSTTITFNSYNLQTTADADATILTRDINHRSIPTKEINLKFDSIRDSFDVLDSKYSEKIITIYGWLKATDKAHLRTLIDNFKNALRPKENPLVIGYGDSTLTYTGTVRSISCDEEHWMNTQIPFSAEFLCQPFGKATSATSQSWNNQAASLSNESITVTGTYKSLPTITVHIDSETNMTAIKFNNDTNSDWIQVARSFSANEDLIIDCENETVKVDGTTVDFSGVFPNFNAGSNSFDLTVTDSGGYSYDLTIAYWPRYL